MPPIFIERAITPGSRNLLRRRPQVLLNHSGTCNSLSSCLLHVYYTPSQSIYPLRTSQSCSPSCAHHPLVSEMPSPFAAHAAFAKNAPGAPISSLYLIIMPLRHTLLSDIATWTRPGNSSCVYTNSDVTFSHNVAHIDWECLKVSNRISHVITSIPSLRRRKNMH